MIVMSAIASAPAAVTPQGLIAELFRRQPQLAIFGATLLLLAIPALIAQGIDQRIVEGVNVWVKPAKFLVSIGMFAITVAWFFGYARSAWRRSGFSRALVWTIIVTGSFEIGWIGLQAARAEMSHFNDSTPFHAAMYSLMGIMATLMIGAALPLAWQIARRPAPDVSIELRIAIALGMVMTFVLGGGLGYYMGGHYSHAVGPERNGLPLFGWNRLGGDLRVAHFFGIHAMQALPVAAALLAGRRLPTIRRLGLGLFTAGWTAVTLLVFAQAVAGRPLLPL